MDIILNLVVIAIGWGLGLFGFAQFFTIFRFAIPFTAYLEDSGAGIYRRVYILFAKAVVLWTVLLGAAVVIVHIWLPWRFASLLIGYAISAASVWPHCGITASNREEYENAYGKYIDISGLHMEYDILADLFVMERGGKKRRSAKIYVLVLIAVALIGYLAFALLSPDEYYEAILSTSRSNVSAHLVVDRGFMGQTIKSITIPGGRTFKNLSIRFTKQPMFSYKDIGWKIRNAAKIAEEKYHEELPRKVSGAYCASSKSNIYHHRTCPYVKSINSANLLFFSQVDELRLYGMRPCDYCGGNPVK